GQKGMRQLGARYGLNASALAQWHVRLQTDRRDYPTSNPPPPGDPCDIDPNRWMEMLSAACGEKPTVYVLDVGQHQMWASQSLMPGPDDRLLNAGGMGAMGFALPAALGAALVEPRRQIVVIAGDGGIQVNIQELETLYRLGLPVKLFVLNNRSLGMVRQFQDAYMDGRQQSTVIGYGCPDLVQ
ncbi:thiamine pyrophosphate-dependent enzyme, partial [Paenibacillus sp. 598K]|uniref:thiamine pyrophosphate-dependent enzyme n=1 Tax=Paenibacillus sp. 598K TaxID=1117987 RepID=UPI0021A9F79B